MVDFTLPGFMLTGDHASRPAASAVAAGALYSCTTHSLVYQSDGSSWSTWATLTGTGLSDPMTTRGDIIVRNSSNTTARLAIGSSGKVLSSDGTDVSWQTPSASGALTLITDTTLGATATNVTFSSISGSYKHLLILFQCRSDRAGTVFEGVDIQFNTDTGNNYDDINPDYTSAGGAFAGNIAHGAGWLASTAAATAPAGAAGSYEVRINNYANTVFHKQWFTNGHVKYGTGGTDIHVVQNAGSWRNTAAITDIKILTRNGSNFIVGSRFTLYGIN